MYICGASRLNWRRNLPGTARSRHPTRATDRKHPPNLSNRVFFSYNSSTPPTYPHSMAAKRSAAVDTSGIMGNILVIRGHRVLLDSDLASLYQVVTKALTRAVRRNAKRLPEDFMFQLAAEDTGSLRSQSGAFKTGRGKHRKYAPYVTRAQASGNKIHDEI
jgi:hypothetical protein